MVSRTIYANLFCSSFMNKSPVSLEDFDVRKDLVLILVPSKSEQRCNYEVASERSWSKSNRIILYRLNLKNKV